VPPTFVPNPPPPPPDGDGAGDGVAVLGAGDGAAGDAVLGGEEGAGDGVGEGAALVPPSGVVGPPLGPVGVGLFFDGTGKGSPSSLFCACAN
jgi:hypothetical protein